MVVSLPVGVVGVLIGVVIDIRMFRGQFARHADRAIGSIGWVGVQDVGAVCMQDALALDRYILRHAQRHRETLRRTEHGISNSSVAAGRIQQNFTGC